MTSLPCSFFFFFLFLWFDLFCILFEMFWKLLHLLPEFLPLGWLVGRTVVRFVRDGVTTSPFAFLLLEGNKGRRRKEKRWTKTEKKVYLVYYCRYHCHVLPGVRMLCLRCLSWGWQMRAEKMLTGDSSSFWAIEKTRN